MKTTIPKQRQTFTFNAPAAASVLLVGEFTQWQKNPIRLRKQANGVWIATTSLAPGKYRYRFLVDGESRTDPGSTVRVTNHFGTHDAVRVVGNGQENP